MPGGRGKKKQGLRNSPYSKKCSNVVFLEPSSGSDAIKAPDRKRYEEDVEAVMNVIKEKNVLLVSFYLRPQAVFFLFC